MYRNDALIRLRLLALEGDATAKQETAHLDLNVKGYHDLLLMEAGLAKGTIHIHGADDYSICEATRLTLAGHDYLDRIRLEGAPAQA